MIKASIDAIGNPGILEGRGVGTSLSGFTREIDGQTERQIAD